MYLSKLSGKRKILLNGDIHSNEKRSSNIYGSYPLRIGAHSLLVFEIDDNKFDLRVDNLSFEATFNSKMLNSGLSYDNPFAEEKSPYEIQDSHRLIKKSRNESPDYTRKASPEPPRRLASRTAYKAPEPAEEPRKKEEARPAEVPKPQPQAPPRAPEPAPLDLFDAPASYAPASLPEDLFSMPLTSSTTSKTESFNPFEEEPKQTREDTSDHQSTQYQDLFDLDNLHMGDNYSPAVAKKINDANKPVSIGENAPNVPINQLYTNNPQHMNGMMNGMMKGMGMHGVMPGMMPGMMMNPMMAFNPFMTGMMPNPWMNQPTQK